MNYANHIGYSDINPFEVVKRVSEKTLEIRAMESIKDDSVVTTFIPGGFSAYSDNVQKWFIHSKEDNPVIRIRLHSDNQWKDKYGAKYRLNDKPIKFYDYNF